VREREIQRFKEAYMEKGREHAIETARDRERYIQKS
jgi:hypothetical protein